MRKDETKEKKGMRILGMKDWSLARVVIESAYDMNKIGGGRGSRR